MRLPAQLSLRAPSATDTGTIATFEENDVDDDDVPLATTADDTALITAPAPTLGGPEHTSADSPEATELDTAAPATTLPRRSTRPRTLPLRLRENTNRQLTFNPMFSVPEDGGEQGGDQSEEITPDSFGELPMPKYKVGDIVDVGHVDGPLVITKPADSDGDYESKWPLHTAPEKPYLVTDDSIQEMADNNQSAITLLESIPTTTHEANYLSGRDVFTHLETSYGPSVWQPVALPNGSILPSCEFIMAEYNTEMAYTHLATTLNNSATAPRVGITLADEIKMPRFHFQKRTLDPGLLDMINAAEICEVQTLLNIGAFGPLQEELPPGIKEDKTLWVYRAKPDADGFLAKIKARLTLRGDLQRINFQGKDASAPVMEWSTLKTMMSLHCMDPEVNWCQFDIQAAYLTALMRREVWIRLPREHCPAGKIGWFCKVIRALYGGLDSGRCFYEELMQAHTAQGFVRGQHDKCFLSLYSEDGKSWIKLVWHVDDCVSAYKGQAMWNKYVLTMKTKYNFDVEQFHHFIGVRVEREPTGPFLLDLGAQVDKMLRVFHMEDATAANTPVHQERPTKEHCPVTAAEHAAARKVPYQQAVGHLTYLWSILHVEITYPLKIASQFSSCHGEKAWTWVKQIMRFLKGGKHAVTRIRGGNHTSLSLWTDADHGRCPDTRRSLSGAVVMLGVDVIFYSSKYQDCTALNTAEAEIMAAAHGVRTLDYIRHKLAEIRGPFYLEVVRPIPHLIDNQSVIDVGKNPVQPGRNRHMHCKYFFWMEHHPHTTCLTKIASALNVSDILVTYKDPSNFHRLAAIVKGHELPSF